ncbi:MAG: Fic family protein [Candidatus Pacebacteria bacterium]|nr:Fic family protein [Candidatus Paceibacterota bacterium]
MEFHKKLQLILKYSEVTQTQLAAMLDVSFPTLNSWINKKSRPRKGGLFKIDALYIEYVGSLEVDDVVFAQKQKQLALLKKQYSNPFDYIMSRNDIYDFFLLEMTYHTNGIEGSTFNEPEVKAVLFDDVTIPNRTVLEHQEAKNHQAALGFVMRWIREENGKITESLIKRAHEILMNGIMHNAGQYRTHKVRIVGSHMTTKNPLKIEEDMKEFVKACNVVPEDAVFHIAKTHAQFELIHPFSDGNGRVGRLLMLVQAFQNNLAPVLIKKEKKLAYYNYLQESQVNENHLPLTSFIYDALFHGYGLLK